MGDGGVGSGSVDSGCHQLSENIWFVWSKMSYSGDMEGCHACVRRTDGRTECEDSARILETEFAIVMNKTAVICANSVFTGFFSTRISLTVSVYILNCEYQIRIIDTNICDKSYERISGKIGEKISG